MRLFKFSNLKGLFIMFFLGSLSLTAFSQAPVTGKILDETTKESLPGVSVVVKDQKKSVLTGPDGSFKIQVSGNTTIEITFIGYNPKIITVSPGQVLGVIELSVNQMNMKEVIITGNVAIDRKTPVAVSTIRAAQIEEKIGNKEFVEVLRSTPSVYVTKSGGGFGDSRINVRGFDQRNTAVMINGVPVNDMENGWVYWSNWAGLSDIASSMQVQRGLGASKLSIAAVGGNINIVTKATEMTRGGTAALTVGNDGYIKYSVGYSSGKLKNGLAFSVLGSQTTGAGYIEGTKFNGYNYFATLGWEINSKHTLTLTATGAPQWHNQRSIGVAYQTFYGNPKDPSVIVRGPKYNDSWGYYKGKEFSASKNFYHKPVANLNHYWKLNNKTSINSVLYASLGRGGGTGPLGWINKKTMFSLPKDANGQIRFDDIEKWNTGVTVTDFGTTAVDRQNTPWATAGPYIGQYVAYGVSSSNSKGIIRRSSMNSHNWYGGIINIAHNISKKIELNGGVDLRYYKGLHYRRLEDDLGVAAWYDIKDVNEPAKYVTEEDKKNKAIDYNNDGIVKQYGGYLSAEYTSEKFSLFGAFSASNTSYQRVDYFLYQPSDPLRKSIVKNFFGYVGKVGANYRINDAHNFFVNVGYFERAPLFNIVFPNFNNKDIPKGITNEKVMAYEAGYGFRGRIISFKINGYLTEWKDKNFVRNFIDAGSGLTYRTNISGLKALHKGIEFEASVRPINKLNIQLMASVGDWKYKNDVDADITNDNNDVIGNVHLYTKDIKVGDAAQTTFSIDGSYEFFKGLKLRATYYYFDKLYANFSPENRTSASDAGRQAWQLPTYGLLEGMLSYAFNVDGKKITFRLNVDNILDKQYIAESQNDIKYDKTSTTDFEIGKGGSGKSNRVYTGFGRTWSFGFKVNF